MLLSVTGVVQTCLLTCAPHPRSRPSWLCSLCTLECLYLNPGSIQSQTREGNAIVLAWWGCVPLGSLSLCNIRCYFLKVAAQIAWWWEFNQTRFNGALNDCTFLYSDAMEILNWNVGDYVCVGKIMHRNWILGLRFKNIIGIIIIKKHFTMFRWTFWPKLLFPMV